MPAFDHAVTDYLNRTCSFWLNIVPHVTLQSLTIIGISFVYYVLQVDEIALILIGSPPSSHRTMETSKVGEKGLPQIRKTRFQTVIAVVKQNSFPTNVIYSFKVKLLYLNLAITNIMKFFDTIKIKSRNSRLYLKYQSGGYFYLLNSCFKNLLVCFGQNPD